MPVYPILDTELVARLGHDLEDALKAALDAGADWIQIRHKAPFDRDILKRIERCARLHPTLILNDRADYAAMFGCGAHLGQDDLPVSAARAILGFDSALGISTHNEEQFREALSLPVSYVAFGPIFETRSKDKPDPVVGVDRLRDMRRLTKLPLVAIGGITLERAPQALAAGANKIAIIGALWQAPYTLKAFRDNIIQWRKTLMPPV